MIKRPISFIPLFGAISSENETAEKYQDRCLEAIQIIDSMEEPVKDPYILTQINSPGGELDEGIVICDTIKLLSMSGIKMYGLVSGCAASMASLLLQFFDVRLMSPYSSLMIHQISTGIEGNHSDIVEAVDMSHFMMDKMHSIYADYNKINPTKDYWKNYITRKDNYLNAQQALELGLVDHIFDYKKQITDY